jgi:hypothetical protein
MALSPEDLKKLAEGALALQVFIKNTEYAEMVVSIAFGVIPTILGLGAAGIIGSGLIGTAREIMNSISVLKLFRGFIELIPRRDNRGTPPNPPNNWIFIFIFPPSERRRRRLF